METTDKNFVIQKSVNTETIFRTANFEIRKMGAVCKLKISDAILPYLTMGDIKELKELLIFVENDNGQS